MFLHTKSILPTPFRGCYTLVLGERLNGIQEVSGSIPLIYTKNNDSHNQMCESLFYTMKNKLRTNT